MPKYPKEGRYYHHDREPRDSSRDSRDSRDSSYSRDSRDYHDMSEGGRKRDRARGRVQPRQESASEGSRGSYSSRHPGQPPLRRPGEPYPGGSSGGEPQAGPSRSGGSGSPSSDETPVAKPSTYHPATARGEHYGSSVPHQPTPACSETASETASVTGSVGATEANRGSYRGRRVLPVDLVTRPRHIVTKQGSNGQPITLNANYFKLLSTTSWCLHKYRVDFEPEEDRNVIRKGLLRTHRATLGAYIFDGTLMYSTQHHTEPLQLTSTRQADNQVMIIKIRHVGQLNRGDHEYIQFFNIIMRKCLDFLNLKLVGRNYFDPVKRTTIHDYHMELWPGYITSIRQHEHDILMCAEITHKVMRNDTLLDILRDCYQKNYRDYQNMYKSIVIGSIVLTYYNDNTYKIDDVDFTASPQSTFEQKGQQVSYQAYYKNKYNIDIREMRQPMLVSKAKAKDRRAGRSDLVYLIPELCNCTGLTDDMRDNGRLMAALAKFTRVSPSDRIKKLMSFNERLHGVENIVNELTSWDLKLERQLIKIPARVLVCEKIIYGSGDPCQVNNNANWTGDVRNKAMKVNGRLNDWVLVTLERLKRDSQNFVSCLIRAAGGMRFEISNPHIVEIRDDTPGTYANTLENILRKQNPTLILCVAPNNRLDRYSAIKKKCCVDRATPSQVILAKTLQNKSIMSIATKVAVQLNCKIGGFPWTVSIPLSGLMVIGFDVCHDTNTKTKDFGAMVASLDPQYGRYFSAVSSHTTGEELSHDLSVNIVKAMQQFRVVNNTLPKKIVIYRDGVGEGQIPFVVQHEVTEIKTKLQSIYSSPEDLKMAYIIVTKKINTRLFSNGMNPPPGTIVDDVITDPSKYDFLIVAQQVTQGTVTPTAYNVIEDSSGLDVDKIQRLTYKLCHMYFNWSGTVRVPAPCQYAHKLAFLVSQAIHQQPSPTLETLLYFL